MKHKGLVFGIVLLCGFIGYSVWHFFLHERLPLLSYTNAVEGILKTAREVVEKNRAQTNPGALREGAAALRSMQNELIERASETEKRRPSFKKTDEIVAQIEYAAQSPGSRDVVEARFRCALDGIEAVKSMLGTNQDSPQ